MLIDARELTVGETIDAEVRIVGTGPAGLARQEVVDANCQVHGVSNWFIAGSSVFPTRGYANLTPTIITLAIRLADQVKTIMTADSVGVLQSL